MGLIAALNRLDRRYAWSLLGFSLAAAFGAISLYTEFFRDRRPEIKFEVISDASVLDVREKLGDLAIIYGGLDIEKAKRSLRVVVVRIVNEGAEDILNGYYDERTPLGFHIEGGQLLRAEVLSASNTYLRQTVRIDVRVPDTARFNPVILEANEWFTVKCLILHPEGSRPALQPIGKVARVREIRVVDSVDITARPNFLSQAFSGGVWVQATRLTAYFLGFIVLLISVVAPVAAIAGVVSKHSRRKNVRQFKSLTKLELTDQDEYIFERYVEKDIAYLRMLQHATSDEESLNEEVRVHEEHRHRMEHVHEAEPGIVISSGGASSPYIFHVRLDVSDMKRSGFISQGDGRWHVDHHLRETLHEFIKFLEIKRAA